MELVIIFIFQCLCICCLLIAYYKLSSPYWKDFLKSYNFNDYAEGYISINNQKFYSPKYKACLCAAICFPLIIIILVIMSALFIWWIGFIGVGQQILNFIITIIPLYNLLNPIQQKRDYILQNYISIQQLLSKIENKDQFLEAWNKMEEKPNTEFQVYCNKYNEELS